MTVVQANYRSVVEPAAVQMIAKWNLKFANSAGIMKVNEFLFRANQLKRNSMCVDAVVDPKNELQVPARDSKLISITKSNLRLVLTNTIFGFKIGSLDEFLRQGESS